jgi:hypothetical protein
MAKNLYSGAIINSGATLPLASDVPLGSLFMKTGATPGLYFFGFTPDASTAFGNQSAQAWSQLVDTSGNTFVSQLGDSMRGDLLMTNGSNIKLTTSGSKLENTGGQLVISASTASGSISFSTAGVERMNIDNTGLVAISSGVLTLGGGTVWHSLNDGVSSGLDADLLRGKASSELDSGLTIAARDSNGNLAAYYFEATSPNSETAAVSQVMYTNGTDDIIRKKSIATFTAAVQSSATGNWSINATTANTANSATSASTGATVAVTTDTTALATTAFVHDILPYGAIIMWSGTAATIPTGWALCDGGNGTPNLVGKFIRGANAATARTTGGSDNAVVVDHGHTGSFSNVSVPPHQHDSGWGESPPDYPAPFGFSGRVNAIGSGSSDGDNHAFLTSSTIYNASGTMSGTITIGNAGEVATGKNVPAYYALCYIMKTSGA